MAKRRKPPERRRAGPARPRPGAATATGAGVRATGSVTVSPRFTLFGGGLLNFHFGGRGKGRRGGMLRRITGLVGKGLAEMRGGSSGGRAPGKSTGRTFADFQAGRPDLFDQEPDGVDDLDDDDSEDAPDCVPDHGGRPGGPTTRSHCCSCGRAPGTGHDHACPSGWHL